MPFAAKEGMLASPSDDEIFSLAAGVAALETHQGDTAVRGQIPHQGIFPENSSIRVSEMWVKCSGTHQLSEWSRSQTALGPTIYLYDGPNPLEEVDSSGNVQARYTQGGIDEPLSQLRSGTTSYYQQDGLGSTTSLSSSAGALANTYAYDSFGKLTASTGTLTNPFQYTGREFDQETSIYEYRARYYDPGVGRFGSEDPLRFDIAPNFYPYVNNNPVSHIDPSGLCPCNYHKVKLYYTPNYGGSGYPDYHWYRQDSNGGWSSKHGWAPVGPQVDPAKDAAASGYGVFCANMCAPNQNGSAPIYNPVPWNDPKHIHTNNCYSYACDRLHPPGPDTKPQPGGHNPAPDFKCIDIINAAQRDGLALDFDVPAN